MNHFFKCFIIYTCAFKIFDYKFILFRCRHFRNIAIWRTYCKDFQIKFSFSFKREINRRKRRLTLLPILTFTFFIIHNDDENDVQSIIFFLLLLCLLSKYVMSLLFTIFVILNIAIISQFFAWRRVSHKILNINCWRQSCSCIFDAFKFACKYIKTPHWMLNPAWVFKFKERLLDANDEKLNFKMWRSNHEDAEPQK